MDVFLDQSLGEDAALAQLQRHDLSPQVFDALSKNGAALKSRKVRLAIVQHPRAPRHVALPMLRHLFTFELMQVALTPLTPADIKLAAEEALIHRLESVSSGEKLSLAHRASGRVAAELLRDAEARVMQAALENARLTEAAVVKALIHADAPAALVRAVAHHEKWSLRREVRAALLRSEHTPGERAAEFVLSFSAAQAREILEGSDLAEERKSQLLNAIADRVAGR